MDVAIGQLIDSKYRIVRLLGQGGMGAVYEGENVRIHHRVAIKVLHAGIATRGDAIERFEREAQAAGKIGSDHIVEVYDLGGFPNGARYMVMEYLEGENLSMRVQNVGRMLPEAIAPIMMQLLEGLGAAHAAGIVHRDLKPDNIFLVRSKTGQDFVKIVDFGVSKFNKLSGDSAMSMTRTGAVIGTPYYMSPEQAKGAKGTDHRSDLYSVGVVLYECATGQVPFQADTFNELMFKIVLETPPDPETLVQGLDPRFSAIIKKAMAREPEGRFQSAAEFQQAVGQWMSTLGAMHGAQYAQPRGMMPSYPGGMADGRMPSHPSYPNHMNHPGAHPSAMTPSNPGGMSLPGGMTPSQLGVTPTVPAPPQPVLSKTAGSLPNVAASVSMSQSRAPKGGGGGIIAAVLAGVVVLAGGGIAAVKLVKGKSAPVEPPSTALAATGAHPPPPVETIAPTPTPTPTVTASAPPPPSASVAASASASAQTPVPTARVGSHGTPPVAGGPKPAASPASSAPGANTAQVKGRTIRTDL